jgi:hypothetical protein
MNWKKLVGTTSTCLCVFTQTWKAEWVLGKVGLFMIGEECEIVENFEDKLEN